MKKELFNELLQSVRQGGAILRNERRLARIYKFSELDLRSIQETLYLSSIPGMRESIGQGLKTPLEKCCKTLKW